MGIEYSLANNKNKTLFDLGKGSWYALCNHQRKGLPELLYAEEIQDIIENEIFDHWDKTKENKDYFQRLSKSIHKFIDDSDPEINISLTNDSDDSNLELKEIGYIYVGHRYDYSEEESKKYLNDLNQ